MDLKGLRTTRVCPRSKQSLIDSSLYRWFVMLPRHRGETNISDDMRIHRVESDGSVMACLMCLFFSEWPILRNSIVLIRL